MALFVSCPTRLSAKQMKITPGLRLILVVALAALTVACVILFLGRAQPVSADPTESYYVALGGANTPGCGRGYVVTPCLTVNYAISEANVGETVVISPGTFTENVNLNKAITLTGAVMGQAVISTTSAGIVVTASGAIISGTTIVGDGSGEGITVTAGLTNVSILNNEIYSYGVGIQLNGGSVHLLQGNVITGNSIGIVAAGDLSFLAHGNVISGNPTAGILLTGTGPLTATLSGAQGNANTFFNNGINITVTAPYSQPNVDAYWNNWGVSPFSNVGATIYHHANAPDLKQVDYFTLTATVAPTQALAEGVSAVTATVSITGFVGSGAGSVISLTSSGPVTVPPTATTGADGNAIFPITSTLAGVETITATINGKAAVVTATFQALPEVQFDSSNLSVYENAGPAVVTATLSSPSAFTVTVNITTSDGTASHLSDYAAVSATLNFAPGVTTVTTTVPITDNNVYESDETVNLALSSPSNATLGTPSATTLTILNDDPLPTAQFNSAPYNVYENASPAVVTVTLSNPSAFAVTVNITTSDGTASYLSDYAAISATLNFAPGVTTVTTTVPITNDNVYESDETVNLALSSPSNATLGTPNTTTLTLLKDEPQPTAQFSSAPYSINENAGPAVVTATLSGPSAFTTTVNITTSDGTASHLSDYAAISATLNFAPGVTTVTTTVPITNDNVYESAETVNLALSSPSGATLGTPSATTLTILNDDPLPTAQFNSAPYNVYENAGPAVITVTLSNPSAFAVTVNITTSDGTASHLSDYAAISATLNFAPGVTTVTTTVPITNDNVYESNETVNLALSGPSGATLGTPIATTLTILNDDPLPTAQFNSAPYNVYENAGPAVVTATLSNPSAFAVTVNITTSDGTASHLSDYAAISATLNFAPGVTIVTTTVPITNDNVYESNETVNLTLSSPSSATLGTPSTTTLTILNDDPLPTAQFNSAPYNVYENAGPAVVTATLSNPSAFAVTVNITTSDGTASYLSDYAAISATLNFAPGVTTVTTTVPITNDNVYEGNETVNLALSSPSSATLGTPSATTLTIVEDEPQPTVQFSGAPYSINENAGPAVVTATLSGLSAFTTTVNITTSDGTASHLSDYAAISATLNFAPGVTTVTTTVPITNDNLYESNETVNLALSNAISATLGTPYTATLTIVDNDTPTRIDVQVNPSTLIAKSGATSIITATAFDDDNHQIAGVTLSGSTFPPFVLGDVSGLGTTNASGQVTGTWTAGNYIESGVLNVTHGSLIGTAAITLTAGPPYSVTLQPDIPSIVVTTTYIGLTARSYRSIR